MSSRLLVISAPSGAGKTTLCARLLRDFPQLTLSISSTTRAPRGQEQHGKEYYFLSHETFRQGIDQGRFAEWAEVHGNFYGTSREVIDRAFASGLSVLLDIDVQGAMSLRAAYPHQSHLIFISPPSMQILEERLRARGTENENQIQTRLANAQREMDRADQFDRVIINDDLERAYDELKRAVTALLSSPPAGGAP